MRIMQDAISNGLLILAIMIMLYFIFVAHLLDLMIYPMLLVVGTLTLRLFVNRKVLRDEELEPPEIKSIFIYYLVALVGIGIGSWLIRGLYDFPFEKYLTIARLQVIDAGLFTSLMAIVETQFFQGELLEYMSNTMSPSLAVIASSFVFMAYHLGVYGTQPENLLYVFIGGLSLAYVTVQSRRISPALLAHITNNLLSVMGV